ncbi:MAG: hypothetical protein EXS31_16165 [Pedosphaera sp.]|nr:hypothetical protein [Pedosphaera sp.]
MQPINFDSVLDTIIERDTRYHREAYLFLRGALDYVQKPIAKARKLEMCHITGQQLTEGIRAYAIDQFGPMAMMVLNEWGIHRCEDFGELVFNMVDQGLLSKTDTDSRDDFKNGYDFFDAFRKPFIPASRQKVAQPEERPQKS